MAASSSIPGTSLRRLCWNAIWAWSSSRRARGRGSSGPAAAIASSSRAACGSPASYLAWAPSSARLARAAGSGDSSAAGRRPVHVRRRRRPGPQGPRRWPRRQRPRPRGDRRQRRRPPRDPRPAGHQRRRRRRLARLLPRPDRPRPDRSPPGHLRRPPRPGRRHRRHPARRQLATLPHPLRRQPHVNHSENLLALGQNPAAQRLRPTRHWPFVRNRRSAGSPIPWAVSASSTCSAGIHCRAPINACPTCSRT